MIRTSPSTEQPEAVQQSPVISILLADVSCQHHYLSTALDAADRERCRHTPRLHERADWRTSRFLKQQAAAELADRYISDRFLPDKAIDLVDEAGARLRIRRMTAPPELRELDEKIAEVRRNKEAAIDDQDFEKAASLRDEESKLNEERKAKEEAWKGGESDEIAEVGDQEIAEVLAMSTGIPVVRLTQTETAKLLKMEDELHKRVIGQDEAVKALAQSIRRTRSGLKDPNRPGGSFIFAGPTGVGKTELAKALAEFLFGDEDALIQLDMSEFSEKHTASRLFGAPPGYVGYDEGGHRDDDLRHGGDHHLYDGHHHDGGGHYGHLHGDGVRVMVFLL